MNHFMCLATLWLCGLGTADPPVTGSDSIDDLIAYAKDTTKPEEKRVEKLIELGRRGQAARSALGELLKLLEDPSGNVACTAAGATRDIGPITTAELLQATRAKSRQVRALAIWAYGKTGREAMAKLLDWTRDDNLMVRQAAATALGDMGPDALKPLTDLLQFGDIRMAVMSGITQIRPFSPAVLNTLLQELDHPLDEIERGRIFSCISELGPNARAAIPVLLKLNEPGDQWHIKETLEWIVVDKEGVQVMLDVLKAKENIRARRLIPQDYAAQALAPLAGAFPEILPAIKAAAEQLDRREVHDSLLVATQNVDRHDTTVRQRHLEISSAGRGTWFQEELREKNRRAITPGDFEKLINDIKQGTKGERFNAYSILQFTDSPGGITAAINTLADEDQCKWAMRYLARMLPESRKELLKTIYNSQEELARANAVRVLMEAGPESVSLAREYSDSKDPALRAGAASIAPQGAEGAKIALQLTRDEHDEVRMSAYMELRKGTVATPDVAEAYLRGLSDTVPYIKGLSKQGMLRIGSYARVCIPQLLKIQETSTSRNTLDILQKIAPDDERVRRVIINGLLSSDEQTRFSAQAYTQSQESLEVLPPLAVVISRNAIARRNDTNFQLAIRDYHRIFNWWMTEAKQSKEAADNVAAVLARMLADPEITEDYKGRIRASLAQIRPQAVPPKDD